MDTNMEVNFSNTNPVAETLRLQPPSWLVLTQSGISINLSSGEVIIPENLELSAASREFWNSVSNLAKTRISEMRLGTDSAIRILEDIKSAINHAGRSYLLEVEGNLISLITINLRQQDRRIAELETQLAAEQKKVADLEKPAAFGWQCYQDRCENAYVEQSVVKRLEAALQVAREALRKVKCSCRYRDIWKCPQCSGELVPVSAPGWMNADQWDAVKAGDFMCNSCSDTETKTGKKYWFDSDLSKELIGQCGAERTNVTTLKPSELTLHERTFLRLTDSINQLFEDKEKVRKVIRETGCRHVFTTECGGGLTICTICWELVK